MLVRAEKNSESLVARDIDLLDGHCYVIDGFLGLPQADRYFTQIRNKTQWQQPAITMFGKHVLSPRLAAWYGDEGAVYRYSGLWNQPLEWFDELLEIRKKTEHLLDCSFNSVLVNLYRDGADSMGLHSDNEPELGPQPTIASISLGQARRFVLKHKTNKALPSVDIVLEHGSMLVMTGQTQTHWKHCLPKTRKLVSDRINLTYRWVNPQHYVH